MYRTLPDRRPARRCLVRAQLLDLLHMGGRCSLSGLVRVQGQVARAESEVCKFCSSAIQLPSSAVHRMELLATLVRARSTLGVREATLAFAAARGRSAAGAVITCAAAGNASRSNPSPGAPAPAAPTAYLCPQRRSSRAAAAPQLGRVGHCAAGRPTRCGTTSEMAHEAKRGAAPILATSSVSCAPSAPGPAQSIARSPRG